jgi:hypothetical protein
MVAFSIADVGKALQRRWKLLAALGFAVTTYTLAGFFLVPWLAKSYIEGYVRDDLKRQIAIGEISFNPFTFAADVQNFALTEADGSPIASFDLLRVDFSLSSIFNRAWTFAEVRLDAPQLRVLVGSDGLLNLAKLVPPSTEPEPAEPAGVRAVAPMTPMDVMGAMPPAPDPAVVEADIAFVEKSLRERITVTQSSRDELAARADVVQAAILANAQVDPQRVFRSERTSGAPDMAGNARMELKLE